MPPTDLIDSKAVRELLGVSRQTLYRYIKDGKIPVYRFTPRGPMRFSRAEVAAALSKTSQP